MDSAPSGPERDRVGSSEEAESVVKGRSTPDGRPRIAWFVAPVLAALAAPTSGQEVRLTEAAERGTFNVGAARASVNPSTDPDAGAILRFDYTIPPGAAAGVWAKRFPEGLKEGGVDVVRPSARAADPGRLRQVAVTLEIKGSAGVQRIPLELHHDWAPAQQDVDWKAIGTLSEVVVSVSRVGEGEPASGTIDLDVRFERLPLSQRLATYRAARLGGVLLVGLVAALLAGLAPRATAGPRPRGGLLRDAVQGAGAVAIAGLAIGIYALSSRGPMEVGWLPLGFAVAGVALGEWWKFGLTGRHLTPVEALRDGLATGLLAASSSPLAILQAPREWSDLLALSGIVAAVAAALYHAANAVKAGLLGAAPGRDRRRPDRRHALRGRGARAAGVRRADADARERPDAPGRCPATPRRPGSSGGWRSSSPSTRWWPTPSAWRRSGPRSGRRRRTWRCWPWRSPRSPGPGSRPWARAGRSPPGGRRPACWPSWRPRSCRRRGSGPRGIS